MPQSLQRKVFLDDDTVWFSSLRQPEGGSIGPVEDIAGDVEAIRTINLDGTCLRVAEDTLVHPRHPCCLSSTREAKVVEPQRRLLVEVFSHSQEVYVAQARRAHPRAVRRPTNVHISAMLNSFFGCPEDNVGSPTEQGDMRGEINISLPMSILIRNHTSKVSVRQRTIQGYSGHIVSSLIRRGDDSSCLCLSRRRRVRILC
mmetsp:Transcript_30058/g.69210  ORF Transcript_30058/g.69210 Transcript_30058/m.69210 type:complete len:201 (-) Transcript_30058:3218-3820(-)